MRVIQAEPLVWLAIADQLSGLPGRRPVADRIRARLAEYPHANYLNIGFSSWAYRDVLAALTEIEGNPA